MKQSNDFNFKDIFFFDKMLVPVIVKYLYWISIFVSLVIALAGIFSFNGFASVIMSILGFLISVIVSRVFYELVIIIFKIYEKLSLLSADKEKDSE